MRDLNSKIVTLYRATSRAERNDYETYGQFRTARNTLEGKQFFKSEHAGREFARTAEERNYRPPYSFLFTIDIDEDCLNQFGLQPQILDGFEAITINEDDLPAFNNCVNFIDNNAL